MQAARQPPRLREKRTKANAGQTVQSIKDRKRPLFIAIVRSQTVTAGEDASALWIAS